MSPLSMWVIWRVPLALAALTIIGLLSVLLGQGGAWLVALLDLADDPYGPHRCVRCPQQDRAKVQSIVNPGNTASPLGPPGTAVGAGSQQTIADLLADVEARNRVLNGGQLHLLSNTKSPWHSCAT